MRRCLMCKVVGFTYRIIQPALSGAIYAVLQHTRDTFTVPYVVPGSTFTVGLLYLDVFIVEIARSLVPRCYFPLS